MPKLWKVLVEMTVEPQDFPNGVTNGFMNILTWAESTAEAEGKIANNFTTYNWHIVAVEESVVIEPDFVFDDDELQDMHERARTNPNAVLLGTFHGYKVN